MLWKLLQLLSTFTNRFTYTYVLLVIMVSNDLVSNTGLSNVVSLSSEGRVYSFLQEGGGEVRRISGSDSSWEG